MVFVVWWTSLCWKLQLKTLRSLEVELPFSLQRKSNFVLISFFLSLHCHGRMDFELTGFCSMQLQMGCHFGKCGELARHVFLSLVFTGSLKGKLHQCHFLSAKGLRTLLGSHSSRENTYSWSYFEVVKKLEDRVNQLQTALQHLELRPRGLENTSGVGLQLGRANDELLPDRRYNWTELVAVWTFSYFALFSW